MFILIPILIIVFITVVIVAIKSADKEDFFDTVYLYGESITTKGSNSDNLEAI